MNQLIIFIVIVGGYTYFGGSNVPKLLKDNKQIFLGIFLGLMIYQFNLVEGFLPQGTCSSPPPEECGGDKCLKAADFMGWKDEKGDIWNSKSQGQTFNKWKNPLTEPKRARPTFTQKTIPCDKCICRKNIPADGYSKPEYTWCCDEGCSGSCKDNEDRDILLPDRVSPSSPYTDEHLEEMCKDRGYTWSSPAKFYSNSNTKKSMYSDTERENCNGKQAFINDYLQRGYPHFDYASFCEPSERLTKFKDIYDGIQGEVDNVLNKAKDDYKVLREEGKRQWGTINDCWNASGNNRLNKGIQELQKNYAELQKNNAECLDKLNSLSPHPSPSPSPSPRALND